jgi:hypothetical protein
VIDEHASLLSLVSGLSSDLVIIDLRAIQKLNSMGISRWVHFLEALTERPSRKVVLSHCSPSFLEFGLMIPNALKGAVLESAFVPFWCEDCDADALQLVRGREAGGAAEVLCPECDQPMQAQLPLADVLLLFRPHGSHRESQRA